jgi:hypothetical protein
MQIRILLNTSYICIRIISINTKQIYLNITFATRLRFCSTKHDLYIYLDFMRGVCAYLFYIQYRFAYQVFDFKSRGQAGCLCIFQNREEMFIKRGQRTQVCEKDASKLNENCNLYIC